MLNVKIIGAQVRQRRLAAQLTQAEFSKRAGVSRATINALETGSIKEIGVNRLMAIVSASNELSQPTKPSTRTGLRKSERLGLSFPYDWSNPNLSDEILIGKVVERGIFEDLARISAIFGVDKVGPRVRAFAEQNPPAARNLNRMFASILEVADNA